MKDGSNQLLLLLTTLLGGQRLCSGGVSLKGENTVN